MNNWEASRNKCDALHERENVKNIIEGVLYLVKFSKSKALPWVLFTFLKLYKWYQIAKSTTDGKRI